MKRITKRPESQFGRELAQFCSVAGYTYKGLAFEADVSIDTLYEARKSDTAGKAVQEKVREFMQRKYDELNIAV